MRSRDRVSSKAARISRWGSLVVDCACGTESSFSQNELAHAVGATTRCVTCGSLLGIDAAGARAMAAARALGADTLHLIPAVLPHLTRFYRYGTEYGPE